MNAITLYGRVGQDPETKDVNGTTLTKLSLATTERWKDKNGDKQEKTQWHNLDIWGKTAEVARDWVKKGDPLLVTGSVEYSSTGEGDNRKYFTSIRVKELHLMPKGEPKADKAKAPEADEEIDDLPF